MIFPCLILCFCLGGCGDDKKVELIIKTPMQAMRTISNQSIQDVPTFLTRAGSAYSREDPTVSPVVRTFNYVDEINAISETFNTPLAPDILFGALFNLAGYVDMGRVAPIDDIIDKTLFEDIDPYGWHIGKRDGKQFFMPFFYMQNILIYNKRLFRDCGLERFMAPGIGDWSLAEWQEILDTLAQKLPAGKYPLAIFARNNQGDTHIMTYLRAFGGDIFNAEGKFDFQQPKIIQALAWLQEGIRRKWFPPQPQNLEMKDCSELFINGQLAIYMFNNANRALYSNAEDYGFVNYPGNHATVFYNGFVIFDNGDPEKLKAAKKFIRYIYDTEEWLDLSAGNLPASKRVLNKYHDQIIMLDDFTKNSINVIDFVNKTPNWQGREDSVRSVFWPNIRQLLMLKVTPEQCAANLDKSCNKALEIGLSMRKLHE